MQMLFQILLSTTMMLGVVSFSNPVHAETNECVHPESRTKHKDCDHKECKHEDCDHKDCKHKDCDGKDCKHEDCDHKECKHEDCDHKDCKHKDCDGKDCKHKDCDHKDCKHKDCDHKDCKHKDCDHKDCKHKDCDHKDCKHKDCDGKECRHKDAKNDSTQPIIGTNEVHVKVHGVVCSFCAYGIQKKLSGLDFVDATRYEKGVKVDIDQQLIVLAVQPDKPIKAKDIQSLIRDAGYEPTMGWHRGSDEQTVKLFGEAK